MTATTAIGYEKNLPATDPEALTAREVEVPELGPHDLLVEVEAVSVNPVDVKLREGAPANGFKVLGFDAAGTVREVGSAVTLFAPGDEVYYAGSIDRPGTNQRLHVVDERITGRKPQVLSFADAAALPLTAITAWETLFERLALTEDSTGTLLVIGATGGVGSIMLALADALLPNVTVIATASDDERSAWVRNLGAEHVVNHRDDLAEQVPRIAADQDALDFWRQPGRYVTGEFEVPLLRSHTAGDLAVPPAVLQGYAKQVRSSGNNALYRTTFVDRAGHCNYTAAEIVTQVELKRPRFSAAPMRVAALG